MHCFETIANNLLRKKNIQLIEFGTVEVCECAARTGGNPQTGEEINIPTSKVPAFKAGKD